MNDKTDCMITSETAKTTVYLRKSQGDLVGRLHNSFFENDVSFSGVSDFITKFLLLFEKLEFPQESFDLREFKQSSKNKKEKMVVRMENKIVEVNKADAKFIVHVKCRQNASWQGTIKWVETNEEKQFRSVLELIKLMDQAVSVEGKEQLEWIREA